MKKKQKILPKINKLLKVSLASVLAFSLAYTSGITSAQARTDTFNLIKGYTYENTESTTPKDVLGVVTEKRGSDEYSYGYKIKDTSNDIHNMPPGMSANIGHGTGDNLETAWVSVFLGTPTTTGIYKTEIDYTKTTILNGKYQPDEINTRTVTFLIEPYVTGFSLKGTNSLTNGNTSKYTIEDITWQGNKEESDPITEKWAVTHKTSDATVIDQNGNLTIGADETKEYVTVEASLINGGAVIDTKRMNVNTGNVIKNVTGISDLVTYAYNDREVTLTGTVEPADAVNTNITWSLAPGYSAVAELDGNVLKPKNQNSVVKVIATVVGGGKDGADYTQQIDIKTYPNYSDPFKAITDITASIPDEVEAEKWIKVDEFNPEISPSDASQQEITWSILDAGTTETKFNDDPRQTYFQPMKSGILVIRATVNGGAAPYKSYTKDFTIKVNPAFVKVKSVVNLPSKAFTGVDLELTGTVKPDDATYKDITSWRITDAGNTGATLDGNILKTTAPGVVKIEATVKNGQAVGLDMWEHFNVKVIDYVPVDSATLNTTTIEAGKDRKYLDCSVKPSDAAEYPMKWSVLDDGGTGAEIVDNYYMKATSPGTVTVKLIVKQGTSLTEDYEKTFTLTVTGDHKPVTDITDVPTSGVAETDLALTGKVTPVGAPSKITWSVKDAGTTGATIDGSTLKTTAGGTVVVTATIVGGGQTDKDDYTKDFTINIAAVYHKVTNITGVPTSGTADHKLELTGTVEPTNATNKNIVWSIKSAGSTGAVLNGKNLMTTAAGTVTVTATIAGGGETADEDYTQNFDITIAANPNPYKAVTDITGVSTSGTATIDMILSGTIAPTDATNQNITWSVKDAGTTGATIDGNTLKTTAKGTVVVTATVEGGGTTSTQDYTKDFTITIKENHKSVTGITGISTSGTAKQTILLNATITPSDASKTNIVWTIKNAGTTGASIVNGNQLKTTGAGTVVVTATIPGGGETSDDDYTKDFTITIALAPTYTLTKDVTELTGAKVTLSETTGIESDGSVTVDVSPDTGKKFNTAPNVSVTGAQIDQVITMPNGDYRYILKNFTANATVKVVGEAKSEDPLEEYQITVQTNGNGTASANVNKSEAGKVITLFKEAKPGYRFVKWEVVNETITIKNDKFTMPKGNVSIKAVFEKIPGPDDPETSTDDSDKSNDGNQDGSGSDSTSKDKDSAIKDTGASSSNTTTSMMVLIALAGICVLEKKRRVSDK